MISGDFNFLQEMLKRESGLVLTEEKSYLLESRLIPVARKLSLDGIEELVIRAKSGTSPEVRKAIVEAMTTNESFFLEKKKR
jgi:chemotaxis protein methyltransferase CheR